MGVSDAGRGTRTCRENGVREGSEGSLHQVFRNRENVTWLGAGFVGGRREQREEREVEASHRGRQGWLTEQQHLVLMSVTTRFALLNSSASVCTIHLC